MSAPGGTVRIRASQGAIRIVSCSSPAENATFIHYSAPETVLPLQARPEMMPAAISAASLPSALMPSGIRDSLLVDASQCQSAALAVPVDAARA